MERRVGLLWLVTWLPFVVMVLLMIAFSTLWEADSVSHIVWHVLYIPLLVIGVIVARRFARDAATRALTVQGWVLAGLLAIAVAGHLGELLTALVRFGQDGFQNLDTTDLFEDPESSHYKIANITVPAIMLSLLTVVVVTVTAAVQRRRDRRLHSVR
jgi:hypothetical protein